MKDEYVREFNTEEWVSTKPAAFDFLKEYEEQIVPKVQEIEAICQELGLPFHMRFFFEQSARGNSSATTSLLAGPGRATPELLAMTLIDQFDQDTPAQLAALFMAACQKFGGEESPAGIFMP